MLNNALGREILFVGGKGGVGKTTVAAALALRASEAGRRTLVVSTDPAHSTSDLFEMQLGDTPSAVAPNLWAMEIDPAAAVDEYIETVQEHMAGAVAPRLAQEVERHIDIARVSPGAEEAALFERFASILQDMRSDYSHVIFDTAPTGQTLRLLSLPEQMTTWVQSLIGKRHKLNVLNRMWRNVAGAAAATPETGADRVLAALEVRKAKFETARRVLTAQSTTCFVFVLLPERLPILETERAVSTLEKYGIPVGAIIVNRVLPDHADGAFLERRRQREATYVDQIARTFDRYPQLHLGLQETDVVGLDGLRRLLDQMPVDA